MKRLSKILSTTANQQFRVVGMRMIPSLESEYINGPGTVTFPGFSISAFSSRGTNVGVLGFMPCDTLVYLSNAFTNSTGWRADSRSSAELPSRHEIEAAWQPQVPAFVAYVLYGKTLPKLKVKTFPHNETSLSIDRSNFCGLVITDRSLIDSVSFKAFHQEVETKFGNDDILFYGQDGNFSKITPSGKIDNVPLEFPEDALRAGTAQDLVMSDALNKMYDKYMQDLALSFYNPLLQSDRIEELKVAARYATENPLFATLYSDVQLALEALQKSNPTAYPPIDLNKKADVEEPAKSPKPAESKVSAKQLTHRDSDHGGHGQEWTNSGGD